MRRFLTTLMILLVVLVAGLSALVLLVNPNDFRDYMVKQVAVINCSSTGHCVGTSGRSLVSSPGECLSPPRAQASHWFAPTTCVWTWRFYHY